MSAGFYEREKEGVSSQIPNPQIFFELEAFRLLALHPYSPFNEFDHPSEMAGIKGKRKRPQHRTRTVMNFDPILKALRNQEEVEAYLMKSASICLQMSR